MSNYSEEELKREEVRGLFAIGVIASIIAYWQLYPHITKILVRSVNGALVLITADTVFIILLWFWGLYILLTAVSMKTWPKKSAFDVVFDSMKSSALLMYWIGSFVTFGMGALLAVLLLGFIGFRP